MEVARSHNDGSSALGVAEVLKNTGWTLFDLSCLELSEKETAAIARWEEVFGSAFDLDKTSKENAGAYRVEQGVSVGYRMDNEREFFESRLTSTSAPEPNFPSVDDYASTVKCLYSIFSKIADQCIGDVARSIDLDPQAFLDLTDIDLAGVLPECAPRKGSADFGMKDLIPALSSSLLRICKYKSVEPEEEEDPKSECGCANASSPAADSTAGPVTPPKKNVWFGAHTDSSFLTISLCSTTPGLDIVDQETNAWVCPEKLILESVPTIQKSSVIDGVSESTASTVFKSLDKIHHPTDRSTPSSSKFAIVFVGEFLQVLTKNRFRAAVHRVRNFSAESSNDDTKKTNDAHRTRISCPFIVRGRNSAVIDLHNVEKYAHPGGKEALAEDKVPNLDGTSVQLMHKLLDLKRQKCFRENGSAEGSSWVLSAYPVPPLPEEN